MRFTIVPPYDPKIEKEYCCVPAVLQMIQERRNLRFASQDEIGYQLGLIVPKDKMNLFSTARTGPMPENGWGTQTRKNEYSIGNYFTQNGLPLKVDIFVPLDIDDISRFIIHNLMNNNDMIICYNSRVLFGDGDCEHVSLLQEFDAENGKVTIIDPAIGVPKVRKAELSNLIEALGSQATNNLYGLWIVSGTER
ncbi:MAG TPA: hypothetical protein DDW50_07365 [Firmicutes bacterium]|jgi:hypothetical protein|nr:hypothetical protein [Bacillota bacterium]